jgi:hypothetical protein
VLIRDWEDHREQNRDSTETLTLAQQKRRRRKRGGATSSLLAPSTVDVFGMPIRRPDLARPWAERGQRPREPPSSYSMRAGHNGDAARRRRAHLAVDAHAGKGAHRSAAHRLSPSNSRSLVPVEKTEAPGKESNELGFTGVGRRRGFDSPRRARPSIVVRRPRSHRAISGFFRPRRDGKMTAQAQVCFTLNERRRSTRTSALAGRP